MSSNTTRRAVLAGIATVPATTVPALASAPADPVFALIQEHRRAAAVAWHVAHEYDHAQERDARPDESRAINARLGAAHDDAGAARDRLVSAAAEIYCRRSGHFCGTCSKPGRAIAPCCPRTGAPTIWCRGSLERWK
jgi:hypothetical protein